MNLFAQTCAALCFELPQENDTPPKWILLLPSGKVVGRDKREWKNDDPDAVISAFNKGGIPLPFDVEHATELRAPKGKPAPAAGWLTAMENRNGEIWGKAEWNETGANAIKNKEYRFYSPAFLFNKNKRIVSFTSFGLTNKPNLDVSALNRTHIGDFMDKKITEALGLTDEASDDAVFTAINQAKANLDEMTALAQNPPKDKFIPITEYQTALNRAESAENKIQEIEKAAKEAAVVAAVDSACAAGKIFPAEKEDWLGMCRQMGMDKFAERMKSRPVLVPPSGLDGKTLPGTALNSTNDAPPAGYAWEADPGTDALLEKALNYMQTHKDCDFDQAVLSVS